MMQLFNTISAWLGASRRKLATAGVSILALMLAWHVVFGQNGWVAYHQKKQEFQKLQTEVEQMKDENGRLDQQIKSLQTDPKAIEKEAREQFGYVRHNEIMVVLPAPKVKQNTATAQVH